MSATGTAARPWEGLRNLSDRTSLRTKLITGLLALVIAAVAGIAISSIWVLRSYLTTQDDPQLRSVYSFVNSQGLTAVPGVAYQMHGVLVGVQQPGTPIGSSGQQGLPGYGGASPAPSLPAVPTTQFWATPNKGKLLTVAAQSGSDTWRVITEPVDYQLPDGDQVTGTLIVGADLGNINATIDTLTANVLIIGLIIVCILAAAIVVVVRASLRPLIDIEETAGEIATGHLNRRVPERDPRTEIGSLGRSLNTMLSQIETAFHKQEESEAAAHRSEERMRRFIADASHELRTPVTAIRGFAEYYRQRGGLVPRWDRDETASASGAGSVGSASGGPAAASGGPASGGPAAAAASASASAGVDGGLGEAGLTPIDLDRIMQRVEKEAARMGLLVEDLLLLARLDQQRPLARLPVDLLSLAADAVHDARLLAPARTIELSVEPGSAFLITGDEARLRQVIGNLMSNALTHTPDGTPIEVSVGTGLLDPQAGDHTPAVLLDVTDHGPGMSQEQARRAFERFYRTDRARTRATGGSGLGLSIVRALVTAQGGVTSVRTAEGQGATFRIALPLAPEALGHPDDIDVADANVGDDAGFDDNAGFADDAGAGAGAAGAGADAAGAE